MLESGTECPPHILNIVKQSFPTKKLEKVIVLKDNKNFLSQIKNCLIQGVEIDHNNTNKKEFRKHIVVKEITNSEYFAKIYNSVVAFRNECFSYSKILPILNQYSRTPLVMPDCIYCSDNMLILEDLKEVGYQHLDPLTGFTMENVELILTELANLHGASLLIKQRNPEVFHEISTKIQEILYTDEENFLLKTQKFRLDMALKLFESDRRIVENLEKIRGNIADLLKSLIRRSTLFDVINHGDLWFTNLMFNDNQIKFIDFQLMRLCSPAADLSYFLYVNLDPKFLHQHYDNLLQFYLNRLLLNITAEKLTINWLKSEMDEFRLFGFINGIWVMPMFFINQHQDKSEEEFQDFTEISIDEALNRMSDAEMDRFTRLVQYYVK